MKTFLLLLTLLFLFSCGDDSAVVDNSGMREDIDKNEARITVLEKKVDSHFKTIKDDLASFKSQMCFSFDEEGCDSLNSIMAGLEIEMDKIRDSVTSVVYPCGEGNSKEILLQTQDGLVAYFQSSSIKTFSVSDTVNIPDQTIVIPEISITIPSQTFSGYTARFCDTEKRDWSWYAGWHTICTDYDNVSISGLTVEGGIYTYDPADATYRGGEFTFKDKFSITTIDDAYLSVLSKGRYMTSDGTGCRFRINNAGDIVNTSTVTNGSL